MSVNYNTNVENSRLQVVANAIDAGGAPGSLQLLDAFSNALSTLVLSRPCGTVSNRVLTFASISPDPAAAANGLATGARIDDSTGTVVVSGLTVGISSAFDIVLAPNAQIGAGQSIAITSATITGN